MSPVPQACRNGDCSISIISHGRYSSVGEPGGIRRLMKRGNCDVLMCLCCEFAYSVSLNETGGERPQVCCKRGCSIL